MLRIYVKNPAVPVEIQPDITPVKNGLLYNWPAATDVRKITSSDTWRVTESADWKALLLDLGGTDGGIIVQLDTPDHLALCDTNTDYWTSFTGMTNNLNFNFRGSGRRQVIYDEETEITTVSYNLLGVYGFCVNTNNEAGYKESVFFIRNIYALVWILNDLVDIVKNKSGYPIRLVRPATESELLLDDGTACDPYTGNDGKSYRTVKLFDLVWLADNLAEIKFRNGDYIHGFELGTYTPIEDGDWAALTTDGVCCYNDDTDNI